MRKCLTPIGVIDENDLQFVRERYGEPRFGIPAPYTKNKDGSYKQINPHESRFLMPDGKFCSVFHIKPVYYATPQGTWRPLSEVASYFGNKRGMTLKEGWEQKMDMGYLVWYIKRLEAMKSQYGVAVSYPQTYAGIELTPVQVPMLLNASPLTAYPDPNPETNTVDGFSRILTDNQTWSTLRNATDGNYSTDTDSWGRIGQITAGSVSNWRFFGRSIYLFNLSSISGVTVDSTTFSIAGRDKADGLSCTPAAAVVSSAPASNTAIADGDFDSLGASRYADTDVTYLSWTVNDTYNNWTFNANPGIIAVQAAVDGTGILKLGTKIDNDLDNDEPASPTVDYTSYLEGYYAEIADTTKDPKLVVAYTEAAAGPVNLKSLNTNLAANIKSYNTNLIANVKSINTNV